MRGVRRGFTLVELLVVIGVIAVLIGILLPALSRARYQAQVTTCAARLHDLSAGMMLYASENRGYFPRQDIVIATGRNTCDVGNEFYQILHTRYRRPHETFFCPLAMDEQLDPQWALYYAPTGFTRVGYAIWVPRSINNTIVPPAASGSGLTLYDATEVAFGPKRTGEKIAVSTPIVSDLVLTLKVNPHPGPNDISRDASLGIFRNSTHFRGGLIESMHTAYGDGHVERIRGRQIKPRYQGLANNYWNWR